MDLFRVRLNCVDHYQSTPTRFDPQLRNNISPSQIQNEPKVPVIRVFGSTETGQKVCAHIHGAFPYLYIEYSGSSVQEEVGAYIHRLHLSIDHALAVSYRRNLYDGKSRFVARITLVKGIPFYGYHVGYRYFLKIYMLNPIVMTRLADLLRQGVVMGKVFQPFEAHLQYLLQWMTDYNLYGCDYLDARKVYFREPFPSYEDLDNPAHLWHDRSIRIQGHEQNQLPRLSHCALEVDICVQDILNRLDIRSRPIHHDFLESLNQPFSDEKLVHSMAGLWRDETRRRKSKMANPSAGSSPFPPEVLISMSADPRNSQRGGWIHEDEYRENIDALINDERGPMDSNLSFDNFVTQLPLEASVKTAFEAVDDLYPENLGPLLGLKADALEDGEQSVAAEIEVDEDRLFSFDSDDEVSSDSDDNSNRNRQKFNTDDGAEMREDDAENPLEQQPVDVSLDIAPQTSISPSKRQYTGVESTPKRQKLVSQAEDVTENPRSNGVILQSSARENPKDAAPSENHLEESHLSRSSDVAAFPKSAQRNISTSSELTNLKPRSGIQTLNFPVVKDPHDPSTILRLSQGTQSQKEGSKLSPASSSIKASGSGEKPDTLSSSSMNSKATSTDSSILRTLVKSESFSWSQSATILTYNELPPAPQLVVQSLCEFGLPSYIYQDPYYSDEADVPERPREWAGREFKLESLTVPFLPPFSKINSPQSSSEGRDVFGNNAKQEMNYRQRRRACHLRSWEIGTPPPSLLEVMRWAEEHAPSDISQKPETHGHRKAQTSRLSKKGLSQIDGPTQKNKHGFKYTQVQKSTSVRHETQYMSTMSLEVHVNTRGSFVPNPEEDEIQCVFWCLQSDDSALDSHDGLGRGEAGVVLLSSDERIAANIARQIPVEVHHESTELDVLLRIVTIVRDRDPDILTGFEVHGGSWGYLIERARLKYDYDLCDELSRMKSQSHGRFGKENDRWGFNTTSTIRVTGRHMINIWRAMRSEVNLLQYTMENVVFHLLHRRIPHYSWRDLTAWYTDGSAQNFAKVINYYFSRVQLDLDILEQNELIPRTSEQARLLGVDFFSVFSRGSQFKVESLMFRIAKPENFLLVSPSRKQVGGQNALECLPLVMEPQSAFYTSPVLVLDFQSLYPSVMIAYNYCYSTFLGRVVNWRGTNKMGFAEYKRQQRLLELLRDHINIAPNGMMYTKPNVRKSLLAKMLTEILETRVMVKSGMKIDKDDKPLQRLLNNRQLALKLIANVTYGYTSASFSGRMPCSEIADSIVQTARETLEKAISLIHSVKRWGAEVVYGDTDSLFVHLKGRTKDEAFEIGNEIAKTITNMNPRPMKLKFEKVYLPCVLLAKKRYVGFKYESKDQMEPEFDAKGIETVRRDGTPAEQKIEEKALKILFETADLSQVKKYFQKQCHKLMTGSVSIQDFCFAKEVKLGTYSEKGLPTPGALISTRRMLEDHRAEPQYGERVPYVVITGAPGARLIDRCVAPEQLLYSDHNELDAEYYISKNFIPPLERIFNLVGANVRSWYDEMPKVHRIRKIEIVAQMPGKAGDVTVRKTMESYMKATSCLVCKEKLEAEGILCPSCSSNIPVSLFTLRERLKVEENKSRDLEKVCQSCSGLSWSEEVKCDSKDCPVFYSRTRQLSRLGREKATLEPVIALLGSGVDSDGLGW